MVGTLTGFSDPGFAVSPKFRFPHHDKVKHIGHQELEPNHSIRPTFDMQRIDKTNVTRFVRHNY
jgi:hypothetical protein